MESQKDDNSDDNDDNVINVAGESPKMEEMTRLIEEGADNIMPFSDGKFEMGLEENYGEQMVPSTFMSYLEDEVKEIKCLFWAVY